MLHVRFIAALALAGVVVAAPAIGATNEPISITVNMARILRIAAPAATVIIGNPIVADVTIQDPQTLVLTGKSYGETNLIVLDSMGNPIA
ncbi:MAG: pilus assembly protein N-terminal domain-containing protein, partial [Devosia sp.]